MNDTSAASPALPAGTELLGKFRFDACIERVGWMTRYRGHHMILKRPIELLVLDRAPAADPQARARHLEATRIASRLREPMLVDVYEGFEASGLVGAATAPIEGSMSLAEMLLRRPAPWKPSAILHWIMPALQGLGILHRAGLILGALSPRGLVRSRRPDGRKQVQIAAMLTPRLAPPRLDQTLHGGPATHADVPLDQARCMAPEWLGDPRRVDGRADVFSVGVLLYLLVTGATPYPGDDAGAILRAHLSGLPQTPQPPPPASLYGVILRALAPDPTERFASADDLARALRGHEGLPLSPPSATRLWDEAVARLDAARAAGPSVAAAAPPTTPSSPVDVAEAPPTTPSSPVDVAEAPPTAPPSQVDVAEAPPTAPPSPVDVAEAPPTAPPSPVDVAEAPPTAPPSPVEAPAAGTADAQASRPRAASSAPAFDLAALLRGERAKPTTTPDPETPATPPVTASLDRDDDARPSAAALDDDGATTLRDIPQSRDAALVTAASLRDARPTPDAGRAALEEQDAASDAGARDPLIITPSSGEQTLRPRPEPPVASATAAAGPGVTSSSATSKPAARPLPSKPAARPASRKKGGRVGLLISLVLVFLIGVLVVLLGWFFAPHQGDQIPTSVEEEDVVAVLLHATPGGARDVVIVPGGPALLGAVPGRDPWTPAVRTRHAVLLDPFVIDRHEVSVAQYAACVRAGRCPRPQAEAHLLDDPAAATLPVVHVTWKHAEAYCAWVGMRLPTEAEWEKAARSADGLRFPWGDRPDCRLALVSDPACAAAPTGPEPVTARPSGASRAGALGMIGNVWEWTADWYADVAPDGEALAHNPPGPSSGPGKVIKGGGWRSPLQPALARAWNPVESHRADVGFRCAASLPTTARGGAASVFERGATPNHRLDRLLRGGDPVSARAGLPLPDVSAAAPPAPNPAADDD